MKRGSAANRNLDRWVGIPLLWLAARLRRRGTLPPVAQVRRVGILTSTTMGDTLLASGAILQLRELWPEAKFVFFAAAGNRAAAALLPGVDRIVDISLTQPWRAIASARRQRLDVMLDFTGWQRVTALIAIRSGARFTAGFSRAGQHRHGGFDLTAEHRGDRHESENFAALATVLVTASSGTAAPHKPALRAEALSLPLDDCWRGAVVFHCWATGANRAVREWPEPRWVELARALRTRWPEMHLVLTGGPADLSRAAALAEKLEAEVFDAPGGLAAAAVLLRSARLVVSVNTGTMHLAAIVGAPVVALNGPNADRRWGPRGPRAVDVVPPGEGCGYLDLGWEWSRDPALREPGAPSCMERITVEGVMAAVEELLGTGPA